MRRDVVLGYLALAAVLATVVGCDYLLDVKQPRVRILSPKNGERVFAVAEIVVEAEDNRGLRRVEIYADGKRLTSLEKAPWTYTWDLRQTQKDAEHVVKVRAYDRSGNWAEAGVRFFGYGKPTPRPSLERPDVNALTNDPRPVFGWGQVPYAYQYRLQLAREADFSSLVVDTVLRALSWRSRENLPDGTYYWRVSARYSEGDWGPWSEVRSLSVDTEGPGAPTLVAPADGGTRSDPLPRFDWRAVGGATGYQLQVDDESGFGSPEVDEGGLTSTTYTVGRPLADGTYYWRVRAKDAAGNWGGWSGTWHFVVDTEGPAVPVLVSPANEAVTSDPLVRFDWGEVGGAVAYQLQVDDDSGFASPVVNEGGLTTTSYRLQLALVDGTYYWRVRAKDAAGNWGGWSGTWHFVVDTEGPAVPVLVSPANEAVTSDPLVRFDWGEVGGAVAYQLQVDDESGFGSPEVDEGGLTSTTYTVGRPLADGTYYWRVRAKDAAGNVGAWSSVWSLTVLSIEWVYVPGGTFQMGNLWGDGWDFERPVHTVTVNSFYMSKYEITFDQYDRFCEKTGRTKPDDEGWGRGNRPVVNVGWDGAVAFCEWLSQKTGWTVRLPTEAEWEYAARSGGKNERWAGTSDEARLGDYAWYNANSGGQTHPVGQKLPNGLGLYDMSGNVLEWCQDWYASDYYSHSPQNNPQGPSSGTSRVMRGGSWYYDSRYCRTVARGWYRPDVRRNLDGFRVVRPAP